MTDLACYYFLPAVRDGLAQYIKEVPTGPRARVQALLTPRLDDQDSPAHAKTLDVALYGPGDVVGFDPAVVTRTDPRPNTWDFEPNFLAMVEFSVADLPWSFTPTPEDSDGHLRPWITLIVLKDEEFVSLDERQPTEEQKNGLPIRCIRGAQKRSLPNLEAAWMWAHAQVTTTDDTREDDLREKMIADEGVHVVSRLLCPRRLATRTRYTGFVVPTFKLGIVAAGLDVLDDSENAQTLAWSTSGGETVDLPYYYKWEFGTGGRGDFESLARLLEPRALPRLGKRQMDCSSLQYDLPTFPGITPEDRSVVEIEGALKSVELAVAEWNNEVPEIATFRAQLANLLNLPARRVAQVSSGEDPTKPVPVTPPIYGRWQSGQRELNADVSERWQEELNLDPRQRAAAGFGALIVQKEQEALMSSLWDQLGDIESANEIVRRAQLGVAASQRVYDRLSLLTESGLLWTAAPVFDRIGTRSSGPDSRTTIAQQLRTSPIPGAAFDPAFRRVQRRRGGMRKLQRYAGSARKGDDLLARLNQRDLSAAGPPPKPAGMPSICDVTDATIARLERQSEAERRAKGIFRINARVIDRRTRRAVVGMRVEAWDRDPAFNDLVGSAVTNARGMIRIEFSRRYFGEGPFDPRPDIVFRMFRGTERIHGSVSPILRNIEAGDASALIEVDSPPPPPPGLGASYRILGTVVDRANGNGIARLRVEAWDKDPIFSDLLGAAITDAQGGFNIEFEKTYSKEWFLDKRPNLFFRVFRGVELIQSTERAVMSNVPPGETQTKIEVDMPPGAFSPLEPPLPGVNDFCEEAITCERLDAVTSVAGEFGELHKEAARLICGAIEDWLGPQPSPVDERAPVDLSAIYEAVKRALEPRTTIPARIATRIQLGAGVHRRGALGRLESEVEFPQPMYQPLAALSQDLILPGVATVPQNTVAVLKTNRRFVEAYMLGLNDGLASEALWRGAPVYLRTTFFRQFWDVAGLLEGAEAEMEASKDIKRFNEWGAGSKLGEHNPREPGAAEQSVLLVRGDLLKRYPNTLIYIVESLPDGDPALDEYMGGAAAATRIWPIFSGSLPPDLTFLGFNLTPQELCKGNDGNGYFIVFEERLAEPRFGFDAPTEEAPANRSQRWWYDLNWNHLGVQENEHIDIEHAPAGSSGKTPQWGQSSATTANICLQRPVRLAIHASKMLPKSVCAQ